MPAVESLRTAVDTLSRNRVLVLGSLAYALLLAPQQALRFAGVSLAPTLLRIVTFLVTPFFVAGVIGMAFEGIGGETSLGTLTDVGRERYVTLLLGSFVEFGIQLAFGVALVLVALVVAVGAGAGAGGGSLAGAGIAVLAGLAAVAVLGLAYLVVLFVIQFYPVVIVADGTDAVEGIRESVGFVRDNPLSTLGYTAVTVVVGTLSMLPVTAFAAYRTLSGASPSSTADGGGAMPGVPGGMGGSNAPPPSELGSLAGAELGLSAPEAVALAGVSVVLTALFFAFRQTYATAFYRRHVASVEERVLGGIGVDDTGGGEGSRDERDA